MIKIISLLFFATVLAFWLSAICGGGASLILIPVLSVVLPASLIPFSLTIGTFTSSASRIVVFKQHINWKIFFGFVPFSIPAVLIGAWLIKYINPLYLQFIVALFLISNLSALFKSKENLKHDEKPYPKYILAIVGFLAGFVSGVTGAIGLLFNRFYLNYGLSKEEIVATRAANEIFLHSIKLVIYLSLGLYSQKAIFLGLTIAIAAIVSSFTVKYILPYLSEFIFKKVGYGAMVISGIFLLSSTSTKIANQGNFYYSIDQAHPEEERTLNWRESDFVLEYSYDNGFEIESPIKKEELPPELKTKYDQLALIYDYILLEKVFQFRQAPSYEFYCYKNNLLTKMDF